MTPLLRWTLLASATTVAVVYGAAVGREAARCLRLELDYRRTRRGAAPPSRTVDSDPAAAIPLVLPPRVPIAPDETRGPGRGEQGHR